MKLALLALGLALASGLAGAEALKKYAVPETVQPAAAEAPAPEPQPADGLNPRQRLAVNTLLRLPPNVRKQWLATFEKREKAAAARKDYEAAAYYQGIIQAAKGEKK